MAGSISDFGPAIRTTIGAIFSGEMNTAEYFEAVRPACRDLCPKTTTRAKIAHTSKNIAKLQLSRKISTYTYILGMDFHQICVSIVRLLQERAKDKFSHKPDQEPRTPQTQSVFRTWDHQQS